MFGVVSEMYSFLSLGIALPICKHLQVLCLKMFAKCKMKYLFCATSDTPHCFNYSSRINPPKSVDLLCWGLTKLVCITLPAVLTDLRSLRLVEPDYLKIHFLIHMIDMFDKS